MVMVPHIAGDQSMSLTRVLVVEDYVPLLRCVCSMLQRRLDFQIVGEASNGLDAIQKAKELAPDVILIDIGLPGLNGIAAARRILALLPECKIIFLTQEYSAEIVEAAFNLGAKGYLIKSRAEGELLPALEAVREGGQFVSSAVAGHLPPAVFGV
jgi:DNA-binding NarL/FixJ family response regulator